jgi:hypothetical protein
MAQRGRSQIHQDIGRLTPRLHARGSVASP